MTGSMAVPGEAKVIMVKITGLAGRYILLITG
jgi:hypothetical protein